MATQLKRQYWRFQRVNFSVWMVVLASIGWGVLRHLQGTLDLTLAQLITLIVLAILSASARTWVGLRDPHIMYSFTIPLATYDVLLISVAVAMTGKYASEVWLLYFMLLVSEAAVMTTPMLFVMIGLAGLGYALACYPLPSGLWIDFGYRVASLGLLSWLIHQVHRTHLEYRAELAELRERVELGRERERIAREFHDGLGSTLVQVILGLERVRHETRSNESASQQACPIQEQIQLLRAALDETRLIIQQLYADEHLDLCQRIQQMGNHVAARLNIEFQFECPQPLPALSPSRTLTIARVVQEALNNIIRHAAGVRTVRITLAQQDKQLVGRIEDDGEGFDVSRALLGFGLRSMQERIESLGGQFTIQSTPGRGTCIEFSVPIEPDEEVSDDGNARKGAPDYRGG